MLNFTLDKHKPAAVKTLDERKPAAKTDADKRDKPKKQSMLNFA
jgi:hypothetical protein